MKSLRLLAVLTVSLYLAACTATADVPATETTVENQTVTDPTEVATDPGAISDPSALVGVWRGKPAGGILEIDDNLQTTFAQNMDDLLGNRDVPTLYRGSIRFDNNTISFEDSRCQVEGAGTYEVHAVEDGGIRFVMMEDECTDRVNNLLGQRLEPQIDITWYPTEAE